jgi:beta-lactamase class A
MRLAGLLLWLVALVAQPAWAEAPLRLKHLEQQLAATAVRSGGEYGIAAMDLGSGRIISFNGNQAFPMASTMKLAVAAAYLSEVDAGRRSLNDQIAGETAVRLMDRMITRSDNRATDLLLAMLGGPRVVDAWLRSHNLRGIRVDRNIAQLLADRRDLRDIRDSSTPAAMLGLLRIIDSGPALSSMSRLVLLDMMRRCITGKNRIRGLMPPWAQVENKTGTLSNYTSDVGFLTLPSGRRIAVAFFARGGENRSGMIASAARSIFDAFSETAAFAPTAPDAMSASGGQ